ncbi:hypothetical protein ACRALDRAFT_1078717 [Sodiomyces alcalophilus JCM 7366]|uniref:uncharacterized protein n=1 Tax=Sodiomyces alcalophilus JCM 7366 TaxID=591952 RepID=UPI0039B59AA3
MSPSEELLDEIEALNSIYGDGTLIPSPSPENQNTYILVLPAPDDHGAALDPTSTADQPSNRLSLRLSFPPSYPASEPPVVLATHSAGANAKPGAAAHALSLFRESVLATFSPGTVCLFDALEDFHTRASQSPANPVFFPEANSEPESTIPANDPNHGPVKGGEHNDNDDNDSPSDPSLGPEPPWVLSDPYTELKSTFLARAAPVSSPAQASSYVSHLLATDRRARAATHNITAWRIRARGPDGTPIHGSSFQDSDDDGETAAGGRMLRLLQLMDAWDVVVVVTRWYGGQKLGPRRFAVINSVAREAVVRLLGEGPGGKAGGGRGGDAGGKKKGK